MKSNRSSARESRSWLCRTRELCKLFVLMMLWCVGCVGAQNAFALTTTTTAISAALNPVYVNQDDILTVTVTGTSPGGSVTLKDGGVDIGTYSVANGRASIAIRFSTIGTHSLIASYSGDSNNASSGGSLSVTVRPLTSTTTVLALSPSSGVANGAVTLTATVSGDNPTGWVDFYDGTHFLSTVALVSGKAIRSGSLDPMAGPHTVVAKYAGDVGNTSSSGSASYSATKANSTLTLSANPSSAYAGQDVTLTALISGGHPSGNVVFKDGGLTLQSVPIVAVDDFSGRAVLTTHFDSAGSHSLSATYDGDVNNVGSNGAASVVVNAKSDTTTTLTATPTTVYVGQGVTLSATVSGNSPSGNVTFMDGATALKTMSLSGGIATYTASFSTAGAHSLSVSYAGDVANKPSSSAVVAETVNPKAATTTAIAVSPNPANLNQTVTLTATVSGSSPSGQVTFMDGGASLGVASLNAGVATLSKVFTSAGAHGLTAVYSGDSVNAGSSSSASSLTINKQATSLGLAVSPTPLYQGQTATLTATITGYNPTGSIAFNDGTTALGSATIAGGKAVLSILPSGVNHSFSAFYSGDANNLGSNATTAGVQTYPAPADSPKPIVNYEYDAEGNPIKTVQAPGVSGFDLTSKASYDSLDRAKDTTDARNKQTLYGYDGLDRLTRVTDPRTLVTQYPRNGLGDQDKLVSPDTGTTTYTYYDDGSLKTALDNRGVLATYTYDALNRLKSIVYSQTGQASRTYSWTYDQTGTGFNYGVGHLTTSSFPAGTQTYAYDPLGRLSSTTQQVVATGGANATPLSHTLAYGYTAGQLTSRTYPSGRVVTYTYTGGQISALSVKANSGAIAQTLLSQIHWQPFGGVDHWLWQMASGTQAYDRNYDDSGRIVRYTLGGVVRDLRYDAAGRITSYTHLLKTDGTAQPNLDQSFGYDELGRLKTVSANGSSWTIGYDDNGNRTSVTLNGSTRAYTTATNSNRLTSISNPARNFGYDTVGNTSSDNGLGYSTTYSLENRLWSVSRGGATVNFSYNDQGQRIRKFSTTGVSSTVVFVYDALNGNLLGEYDSTGQTIKEYVWLGSIPVAVLTPDPANAANPPLVYYIQTDHLNTPRIVVDRNDKRRWRWLAEPFGTTAPETNPENLGVFAFNLRFPGQYFDQETGLNYTWNRYYDASTGRFTSPDPIGLAGGSMSLFQYAEANPLMYVDPNGLWSAADLPSAPQWAEDFVGGWGDMLSFGITARIRDGFDIGSVNKCSGFYKGGEAFGFVNGLALGWAQGTKGAAKAASGNNWANFSHSLFPKRFLKQFDNAVAKWMNKVGNRLNGDYVTPALHTRMDAAAQFGLSREWLASNPLFSPVRQWMNRVPYVPGAAAYGTGSAAVNDCSCEN